MKKEFNKEEYNKLCAEFLGGIEYIPKPWYYFPRYQRHWFFPNRLEPNRFISKMLKFDTDWNWIMEVVEKIESLHVDNYVTTLPMIAKKEPVVQAIWEFLNWYNEQKQ